MNTLLWLIGVYFAISLGLGALYGLFSWLRNRPRPKPRLRVIEGGKPFKSTALGWRGLP